MEPNYYELIRAEFLEPSRLINKELTFGCNLRTPSSGSVGRNAEGGSIDPNSQIFSWNEYCQEGHISV